MQTAIILNDAQISNLLSSTDPALRVERKHAGIYSVRCAAPSKITYIVRTWRAAEQYAFSCGCGRAQDTCPHLRSVAHHIHTLRTAQEA